MLLSHLGTTMAWHTQHHDRAGTALNSLPRSSSFLFTIHAYISRVVLLLFSAGDTLNTIPAG
ncbi:hypothetical protein [Snodgrassella alvi]|uniref:hypothetical protein n=1 Tax=Snodgrassella alvi TaxID=1196083 RepID=UPI0015D56D4D|nr:hypothetical protein [Snodgrassella alvi]